MRTDEKDKANIAEHSFVTYQSLASVRALVKFALFQIDHATEEQFCSFQNEWRTLFMLIDEKAKAADDSNGEVNFLANTVQISDEETHH